MVALGSLFAACGGADATGSDVTTRIVAPDDANEIDEAELPGALPVAPTLLQVKTYDGSGELVHPDAVFYPQRWQGRRYWVAATPYPGGDSRFENPSIFSATSAREMIVPDGATNPLAMPESKAYLSDPDLVADPETNELRMYYRQTLPSGDQLLMTTSRNGVQWSKGQVVLGSVRYALISPAFVREGPGAWRMWTVNASVRGCTSTLAETALEQRRSTDGVTWGPAEPVKLTINGRVPWHWDVQYVAAKQEYWALIAAYPEGTTCSQTAVYFARSQDGTSWNVSPVPLLGPGALPPIQSLVYRSTFHYHEGSDAVTVWFSGARLDGNVFHYAVVSARYPLGELLRRVNGSSAAMLELEQQYPSRDLEEARAKFVADFP